MRVLAALLLLAGCERSEPSRSEASVGSAIPCAIGGAAEFTNACRVARTIAEDRVVLTLIAPDGGFRRIEVAPDGGGVAAADGAESARTSRGEDGEIEVAIARDRYRLPAAAP